MMKCQNEDKEETKKNSEERKEENANIRKDVKDMYNMLMRQIENITGELNKMKEKKET